MMIRHREEEFGDPGVVDCGIKKPTSSGVDELCPACHKPMQVGQHTGIKVIGPGPDPKARELARKGGGYIGVAIEAHWACLTGIES